MAQSTLHFAIGMTVGTVAAVPAVATAWRQHKALAGPFLRWLLLSYALGAYATIPNLLRRTGYLPSLWESNWMNLFLLHHLIDHFATIHIVLGELAVGLVVGLQYGLLLLAIRRSSQSKAP